MRLRYLHLKNVPPLEDLAIRFGHESLLGRAVSIRFVVGINGSGKTRLLQTLTKAFLCLERGIKPSFHITLAYDIKGDRERTIFWRYQADEQQNNGLIEFARSLHDEEITDWEDLRAQVEANPQGLPIRGKILSPDEMQGASLRYILPSSVLVYTSGAADAWQEIFKETNDGVDLPDEISDEDERPWNWDEVAETRYIAETAGAGATEESEKREATSTAEADSVGMFVQHEHLKLVTCAVTLVQAAHDFRQMTNPEAEAHWHEERTTEINRRQPAQGLRAILNEIGWLYPVTIGLRINYDLTLWKKFRANLYKLRKLYECATSVLREPLNQPTRWLYFDLRQTISDGASKDNSTVAALLEALGDEDDTEPFTIFRRLYDWQRQGLIDGVTIAIRKHGLDDALLYDWLSDGERVFLGRMSLLHLMGKYPDSLIILDEPETHFNDYWKRRIVDVIDDNLRDMPSEVVISTHSSIALTDVFRSEITLLSKKETVDGSIAAFEPPIQTFGASPSEIMSKVFEAEDIVGQRANEFLDMVLKLASFPQQVETVWSMFNGSDPSKSAETEQQIHRSTEFQQLWQEVRALHNYENEDRLYSVLAAIKKYIRPEGINANGIKVADVLQAVESKLGPGYYRFEFNRRLASLEKE
jgi:ABC-type multidrug transport system ATPase subunit